MTNYVSILSGALQTAADPERALMMKRYLKDQFEFFGISAPKLKELRHGFIKLHGLPPAGEVNALVRALWNLPQREFQYCAAAISEKMLVKCGYGAIDFIEYMIVNKSWWDTVDWIASHHAGKWFKLFPGEMHSRTFNWISSENIWLQRSAILFQLKYKALTDTEMLLSYCNSVAGSKEFFIRKAIGWALREYSKTNPEAVMNYTSNSQLSGLSKREALKWLNRGSKKINPT